MSPSNPNIFPKTFIHLALLTVNLLLFLATLCLQTHLGLLYLKEGFKEEEYEGGGTSV